jgi:hypothetical protein
MGDIRDDPLYPELPERTRRVYEMREGGMTFTQVGKEFGVTPNRVRDIFESIGYKLSRLHELQRDKEEIAREDEEIEALRTVGPDEPAERLWLAMGYWAYPIYHVAGKNDADTVSPAWSARQLADWLVQIGPTWKGMGAYRIEMLGEFLATTCTEPPRGLEALTNVRERMQLEEIAEAERMVAEAKERVRVLKAKLRALKRNA